MELKYQCPSQSTWKAAASAFVTVLRLGLPIARQQCESHLLENTFLKSFVYIETILN